MSDTPIDIPRAVTKPARKMLNAFRGGFQEGYSEAQESSNSPGKRKVNVGQTERWVSLAGGVALVAYGVTRRSPLGLAFAALGSGLLYRGATRHDALLAALDIDRSGVADNQGSGIKVEKAVTINRPAEELYRYWRNFENLPRFMNHLESVSTLTNLQSHWVAKAPLNTTVEWDAEVTDERENEFISWRSLPGAKVENEGSVRFKAAPGGRGTEVHVKLRYDPPAGVLGATVAKLFGEEPRQQITEDLRRFKRMMEAGEIVTTEGQPSGRNK